jgi:hypothetical protein
MIWWEREIYINLLVEYQERKKQEQMTMMQRSEGFNL